MKVILKEEQQEKLKLPPFIYKAIANKTTSIGDNEALPPFGDFGFEYSVVKKGFEEADEIIGKYVERGELESKDVNYLVSVLSEKIEKCKKIEKTLKPQLEKLCENIVNGYFSIPEDTINIKCTLVGEVTPKNAIRVLPENDTDGNTYDFEDAEEAALTSKVILKRRFINCIIQGISHWLSTDISDLCDTVVEMNNELWGLWFNIIHITDYLLYVKKDEVNEKHPDLLSYVEVKLGKKGRKTNIEAQGVIFPFLLRDTIRGLMELFSANGLPKDVRKAMYIVRKSDFLVAEPWDLRLGIGIIDVMQTSFKKYHAGLLFNTNKIPFFFSDLCKLEVEEFNSVMKNFLLGTRKGEIIAHDMDEKISHDIDYQKFKDRITQKNIKTSVINDGDFSKEELDGYVLQENETDEMMAYHGASADFDKFNHKKFLNTGAGSQCFGWGTYVTDDKEVANGYVNAAKGNGERDFFLNLNPKPYLESLMKYDEEMINDILEAYRHYIVATFRDSMKKTYENAMNVINGMIEWEENNLNIYLPVDKVIKMYSEDPRFSNMSDDEKNKAIEDHKMRYEKKERPVKIFKACADILTHFKPEMDEFLKNRFAYLYEVDIPEDTGENYIDWYFSLYSSQKYRIKNGLETLGKRFNFSGSFDLDMILDEHQDESTGEKLYYQLTNELGSPKAASLFLLHCGFDGIKYPSGTMWKKPDGAAEDAYNYVIFDANKVKIINKTKV